MRCEALDARERFTETGECRFCSGRWLPSRFHLLPSHTPVDEIERLLTHTHTHSHTHTYSRHTSRSHSPSFIHTKAHTYALTNTNCSHFTVIWADMFTLLLIWMSPHCLASFFAILKTPLLSLSKLQADGDESAWLSLGSCESCFSFSLSLSVYLETILHTLLSARRGNLSSTAWHIFVRVQGFLLLHTIFLRSLRGGIFVWICALKHVINNPVCSKWMTCPSVAAISWTATSLSRSRRLELK